VIRAREEKPIRGIEIDLNGPEGNAFSLLKQVEVLGRNFGYSQQRITAIRKVMMMGDYDGLVSVFDREFGHIVTIWR
jgi:hypothetical protein|tara:strand:+ start:333 stop:563 length:231 start_codon:yes stop_codon:yes gene_type:complete